MRTSDVPQDQNPTLAGARKTVYALDEHGRYTTASSTGWTVEAVVTGQAVEEYHRLAGDALARVRAGRASPLEFHMHDRRLDVPTLAAAMGLWRWQVRRHLSPQGFRSLSRDVKTRYAAVLGLDDLDGLPPGLEGPS